MRWLQLCIRDNSGCKDAMNMSNNHEMDFTLIKAFTSSLHSENFRLLPILVINTVTVVQTFVGVQPEKSPLS